MSNTKDENGVVRIATTTNQANNSVDRRKALKKLGLGGALVSGAKWTSPIVASVILPAHAQTSGTTTTTTMGELSGHVWFEEASLGELGTQDPGEPDFPNVVVSLYQVVGHVLVASTITDANGDYLFADLAADAYEVEIINPFPNIIGSFASDYDGQIQPNADGMAEVPLAVGEVKTGVNFSLVVAAS